MEKKLILSISKKTNEDLSNFIGELHKHKIVDNYNVDIIPDPVIYFRNDFINEVVNNGFGSMLNFTVTMDAITTPSMHIDDIERVFHKFVAHLKPINHLLITDPYFYPKLIDVDTIATKFIQLIDPIINEIDKITVVSNGKNKSSINRYIKNLKKANPKIQLENYITQDFHDRFWLNPTVKKGIVVGTSINGIGKKISLVDTLNAVDTSQVIEEVFKIINQENNLTNQRSQ